jgi:hypothetical protein
MRIEILSTRKKLEQTLQRGTERAKATLQSGATLMASTCGSLPMLSSLEVTLFRGDLTVASSPVTTDASGPVSPPLQDETHYFLVPTPVHAAAAEGYVLYIARRLPVGYANSNDLPRVRVFHLPGPGAETTLARRIVFDRHLDSAEVNEDNNSNDDKQSLADRLDTIADEIDQHCGQVTGGLLLIGGVIAVTNPLVGLSVAANALIPSIGGSFAREALKHTSTKLGQWTRGRRDRQEEKRKKREVRRLEKEVRNELRKAETISVVNPLLQTLERALETDEASFDPAFDIDLELLQTGFVLEGWRSYDLMQMSAKAILDVYDNAPDDDTTDPNINRRVGAEDRRWLDLLRSTLDVDSPQSPRASTNDSGVKIIAKKFQQWIKQRNVGDG